MMPFKKFYSGTVAGKATYWWKMEILLRKTKQKKSSS